MQAGVMAKTTIPSSPSPLTKGERTRQRLMDAAVRLLARDGYHDLKITEVSAEAGLSTGVFYIYFRDKNDLVIQIFRQRTAQNMEHVFAGPKETEPFLAILSANRRYIEGFADGGGLNRATSQIVDALPEARAIWREANAAIAERLAASIAKRSPKSRAHKEARLFVAHALQAMLDTLLLQLFNYEIPELEAISGNPERLAQATAILWYRAIYACDPPRRLVPEAKDFLTLVAVTGEEK